MLYALNYFMVFTYGLLIMTFFLDIKFGRKTFLILSVFVLLGMLLNFSIYFIFGDRFLQEVYPLAVHLPLVFFFRLVYKKPLYPVLFVLCTTYILTTPRKWIGDLITLLFHGGPYIAALVQIAVTIPLLYIIYQYLRPYMVKIIAYSSNKIRFLLIIPLVYYIIAYLTTVYTDLLYSSRIVVVGILTIGLICTFSYFLISYFNELVKQFEMKNEQNILAAQVSALQARFEATKQSEETAKIYRHDLRHHLHMLNNYVYSDNITGAKDYIKEIEKNMRPAVTVTYCENESINLILSSYLDKAVQNDIRVDSSVCVPDSCSIPDIDLCIIFANAIENAINACILIENINQRYLNISCKMKQDKLLIQFTNSYAVAPVFEHNLPITEKENHGYGTKSIVAIVHKHQGLTSFEAREGIFKLNIIL